MKFLAITLVALFTAAASAKNCFKPPFQCGVGHKGRSLSLPAGISPYSTTYTCGCSPVDCVTACQQSLEKCQMLCAGDEDMLRCAENFVEKEDQLEVQTLIGNVTVSVEDIVQAGEKEREEGRVRVEDLVREMEGEGN